MRVHIAHDDADTVGVYASRKAAKRALDKYAADLGAIDTTGWARGGDEVDRTVTAIRAFDGKTISWSQWIVTYQVQS